VVFDEGLPMAAIIQRVPGFIEAEPEMATFTNLDELLAISWIARWREPWWEEDEPVNFYRFSVYGSDLMAEYNKGTDWFTVGTMAGADELVTSLPRWHAVESSES
jgi:hypothetical protein